MATYTPKDTPIQTRPTPVKTDTLFFEFVDGKVADKDRIEYGADHPDTRRFPGFKLCKEIRLDYDNVQRWWACEETLQDTYNDNVRYSDEGVEFPVFVRRYVVRRDQYAVRTPLQPRAGVLLVKVTNGGTGYTEPPTVTPSAGTSEYVALINPSGQVCWVVVENDGGDTTAPTLAFTGGDGNGAAATAYVQPQTALLTKQRKLEFGNDDPRSGLFVIHECTYETLPGPEIAETHFDTATGTERTTYRQRVAIGTAANPVAAVEIQQVAVGNPATVTTLKPHDIPVGGVFTVRIAGLLGSTPLVNGDHVATRTGTGTFTIPVNVTVASTLFTGFVSVMKNSQVIIDSVVKPDDEAGTTTGTLITVCATLPGREVYNTFYDTKRSAFVTEFTQYVHLGFGDWFALGTYKGGTIESSNEDPKGTALALLTTNTILLPGNPETVLSFDEETGASRQVIHTRVAIASNPDTIGSLHSAGPNRYFVQSKIIPENSVVGIKQSQTTTIPASRTEVLNGSEPMPRVFVPAAANLAWALSGDGYINHGPFLGVHFTIELNTPASPIFCDISYTIGINPAARPVPFAVLSSRSQVTGLPIDGMTLHDAYTFTETKSGGATQVEEIMPASVPPPGTYVAGDPLNLYTTDRPHEGGKSGLWERREFYVEAPNL